MRRWKTLAVLTMLAALLPLAAAARAACCVPQPAKRACCAGAMASGGMKAHGCCNAPKAPAPDTRSQDRSPLGVIAGAPPVAPATVLSTALPSGPAARLARLGSRAPAPDASPPDLLARYAVLLI